MAEKHWSRWASIAEIISSIAIFSTLIFIVIEIRQNNSLIEQNSLAIRESAIQGLDSGVLDIVTLFSSSQETSAGGTRRMRSYNPSESPVPDEWETLDEQKRIQLVMSF
jgi:hypothetical protein